jgi:hypothetical protein
LTCIAPIRPLQLCADGGYQPSLGVLGVPLIMVPDKYIGNGFFADYFLSGTRQRKVAVTRTGNGDGAFAECST